MLLPYSYVSYFQLSQEESSDLEELLVCVSQKRRARFSAETEQGP